MYTIGIVSAKTAITSSHWVYTSTAILTRAEIAKVVHFAVFAAVTLPTPAAVAASLVDACAAMLTHNVRIACRHVVLTIMLA